MEISQSRDREGAETMAFAEPLAHKHVTAPRPVPLAYFITFTCYGARLHGNASGCVDRGHNRWGTPTLATNPRREAVERKTMCEDSFVMDAPRRDVVLRSMLEVCSHRGWRPWTVHVRSTHVHVVVEAQTGPERVMNDFKAYASRRLDELGLDVARRRRWARHGSTLYIWSVSDLEKRIRYTIEGQGEPMAVFADPGAATSLSAP